MFSLVQWQRRPEWQNWVGYISAAPEQKLTPASVSELQDIVQHARVARQRIRVTGAAHSFSGCACPNEIAISLHHIRGLVAIDSAAKQATFYAGTYLHEIGEALQVHGFALENMGDVAAQSLAGAVSTATHGTGIGLGSIANQVVAWEWIDGLGTRHTHHRGDPKTDELGNALHLSLGMLGIFTKLTIRVVELYGLKERNDVLMFSQGLAAFGDAIHEYRHLEWFLFPGTNKLQQKTLSLTAPHPMSWWQKLKDKFDSVVTLNGIFYLLCELARRRSSLIRSISMLCARSIPNTQREGYSYEVFPTPRGVKFNESEYFIKLSDFEACISEINAVLLKDMKGSHFPIEVRTHKGETGMLSPTQGEDCAVLSFHVYKGMDDGPLFEWLYDYMQIWQGRPHWGKVNKLSCAELQPLYPKLSRFMQIRAQYDPEKLFINNWLEEKFFGTPNQDDFKATQSD